MAKSTLSAGLEAAAGKKQRAVKIEADEAPAKKAKTAPRPQKTVLIGGQFSPEVRRVLLLVQADPKNTGKNLRQLLGEAINDLCAKYRKPQPYSDEN